MAESYRDLVVWRKAMILAEETYNIAAHLPDVEHFALATQLRRAAVSVPSNIAEGHERRSRADYRRFIAIACGSLAELETQLLLAQRPYGLNHEMLAPANKLADETGRMLRAIERRLRSGVSETPAGYEVNQPSALGPRPS